MQLTVDSGQLPMGWKIKKLAEVCQIKPSKEEARKKLSNNDLVSFIPMCDLGVQTKTIYLNENKLFREVVSSYTYFADNDVLLAKITPCFENGKLGIARNLTNGVGFGSSEYIVFRSKGAVDPEYLFYFLSQDSFRNSGTRVMSGAVGHKRVPKDFIGNYPIPLPPLSEQKRIVSILDEAFEGIDKAIANTEKNLANARELFESYLNYIFTQKGEGWVEKKLEDICEVKDGTHDSPKYVESGIPFITQKNIRENGLIFDNIKFISSSDHEKFYARSNVAIGDILISMIGANRGMSCIVDTKKIFSIKNVGLIKASKNVNRYFLLYFLKSKKAQIYVGAASRGGAQPFIGLGKLREFPVSVAPQNSQATIVMKLDELYAETQRLETIYSQKIAALKELKQSILQKAFTGELTADTLKTAKEGIAA